MHIDIETYVDIEIYIYIYIYRERERERERERRIPRARCCNRSAKPNRRIYMGTLPRPPQASICSLLDGGAGSKRMLKVWVFASPDLPQQHFFRARSTIQERNK